VLYAGTQSGVFRSAGQFFARPSGLTTADVPNDQGGKITLEWNSSILDDDLSVFSKYSIWRALPDSLGASPGAAAGTGGGMWRTTGAASVTSAWEWLADVPGHRYKRYAYTASTLFDSATGVSGKHFYRVSAHTTDPNVFYDSAPIAGYSVDNLAPFTPQALRVVAASGNVTLHWRPNVEPDLQGYLVYRSASAAALPDTATPFAIVTDTNAIDMHPAAGTWYYAVRARDVHGNRSTPSPLLPAVVTGVGDQASVVPTEFSLSQNYPNPFNPTTELRFAVPQDAQVVLRVYDVMGREVAELVNGNMPAGFHAVTWDATGVASGLYVYRMTAGNFTQTRKMVLMR
jgi:hypothetical protein